MSHSFSLKAMLSFWDSFFSTWNEAFITPWTILAQKTCFRLRRIPFYLCLALNLDFLCFKFISRFSDTFIITYTQYHTPFEFEEPLDETTIQWFSFFISHVVLRLIYILFMFWFKSFKDICNVSGKRNEIDPNLRFKLLNFWRFFICGNFIIRILSLLSLDILRLLI